MLPTTITTKGELLTLEMLECGERNKAGLSVWCGLHIEISYAKAKKALREALNGFVECNVTRESATGKITYINIRGRE